MGRHHDLKCRKLARQNHTQGAQVLRAAACRDSRILKNRNTTGFAMEPVRANEARASTSLADFGSQVAKKVSGPKEHEPDDAQDQNGKAGGNRQ
jgi:hypothetical protein